MAGLTTRAAALGAAVTLGLLTVGTGCPDDEETPTPISDACQSCLDSGGTWQPEAGECTDSCDIADISCFTDECPGACEDDCAYCFSQEDCEAASCAWHQEAEAMWCTQP